jgi:hypothetical protein
MIKTKPVQNPESFLLKISNMKSTFFICFLSLSLCSSAQTAWWDDDEYGFKSIDQGTREIDPWIKGTNTYMYPSYIRMILSIVPEEVEPSAIQYVDITTSSSRTMAMRPETASTVTSFLVGDWGRKNYGVSSKMPNVVVFGDKCVVYRWAQQKKRWELSISSFREMTIPYRLFLLKTKR